MLHTPERINERIAQAERLWLFLDYDGTLADFAPTPEHVNPDAETIRLLSRLARHPCIRVAVISGRRLDHVQALAPVPGILLAGTYGIELQTPDGERIDRVEYEAIRPALDALKPRWERLIAAREGFFLEDKGWALALHARFANDVETETVLSAARHVADEVVASSESFCVLGGHKFLEICPRLAHKGQTVDYLLDRYAWPGALPLYLGDDDKDEEAFGVIKARGGIAILVAARRRKTDADCRLESPQTVRRWLETLPALCSPPGRNNTLGKASSPGVLTKIEQPHDQDVSDEELVRLCRERLPADPRPFRALVARHRDRAINTAYRFLGNPRDAEDVAQEVFIKVYRGLPDFRATSSFSTWLYRITVNTCKNELRHRSRRPTLLEPDLESLGILLPTVPSAERAVIAREQRDTIQKALDRLSETHREVLILRDAQGLSYEEIADVLGIGLSAAKMRVRRSRLAFQELYKQEWE